MGNLNLIRLHGYLRRSFIPFEIMVSLGEYAEKGTNWIKANPVVGSFILLSAIMTAGSAAGSAIAILCGMPALSSVLANIAAAFATILLVGITGSYALSTQEMVRESRIERMRPHISSLISDGIDEMLIELRNDEEKLEAGDFKTGIPEFTDLRNRGHGEEILMDLRVQDREVMDQWDSYREAKSTYLETRTQVKNDIAELVEDEFINQHQDLEFTDFLPEDAEEGDLRSGMVGGEKSIQSMLRRLSGNMADCILENRELPSFEDENFVGENEIIHRVFTRYNEELLRFREVNTISDKLSELQVQIQTLSEAADETIPVLEEFRTKLKSEYDVPEIMIQDSTSNGYYR